MLRRAGAVSLVKLLPFPQLRRGSVRGFLATWISEDVYCVTLHIGTQAGLRTRDPFSEWRLEMAGKTRSQFEATQSRSDAARKTSQPEVAEVCSQTVLPLSLDRISFRLAALLLSFTLAGSATTLVAQEHIKAHELIQRSDGILKGTSYERQAILRDISKSPFTAKVVASNIVLALDDPDPIVRIEAHRLLIGLGKRLFPLTKDAFPNYNERQQAALVGCYGSVGDESDEFDRFLIGVIKTKPEMVRVRAFSTFRSVPSPRMAELAKNYFLDESRSASERFQAGERLRPLKADIVRYLSVSRLVEYLQDVKKNPAIRSFCAEVLCDLGEGIGDGPWTTITSILENDREDMEVRYIIASAIGENKRLANKFAKIMLNIIDRTSLNPVKSDSIRAAAIEVVLAADPIEDSANILIVAAVDQRTFIRFEALRALRRLKLKNAADAEALIDALCQHPLHEGLVEELQETIILFVPKENVLKRIAKLKLATDFPLFHERLDQFAEQLERSRPKGPSVEKKNH